MINGTNIVTYISLDAGATWKLACFAQDLSITRAMATRDITSKQSQGDRKLAAGLRTWQVSTTGLVAFDAEKATPKDFKAALDGRQRVYVELIDIDADELVLVGQTVSISIDSEAPVEETMIYNLSMEGHGAEAASWSQYYASLVNAKAINIVSQACLLALMNDFFNPTYN
jgi:predicted secreted protein